MAALVGLDSLEILVIVDNEYSIPSNVTKKRTTNSSTGFVNPHTLTLLTKILMQHLAARPNLPLSEPSRPAVRLPQRPRH